MLSIGVYLGLIMAFNVWFIIWPAQKKVLGMVEADDAARLARSTASRKDEAWPTRWVFRSMPRCWWIFPQLGKLKLKQRTRSEPKVLDFSAFQHLARHL